MVVKLPPPSTCVLTLIENVVAERAGGVNHSFFVSIKDEWKRRLMHYVVNGGTPIQIDRWPEAEARKVTFINLYRSPAQNSAQKLVLDDLRGHGLSMCPACGEAGSPNTLDHYMPKDLFPHLSILPHNLFPMCDACQGHKGIEFNDAEEPKFFIHPYFDTFSQDQLVKLTVELTSLAPSFKLHPNPLLNDYEIRLVSTHLTKLDIESRYIVFFKNEFRRLTKLVSRMRADNQDVFVTLNNFKQLNMVPSLNSWEHIFYDGILASGDFLDSLANDSPPQFS